MREPIRLCRCGSPALPDADECQTCLDALRAEAHAVDIQCPNTGECVLVTVRRGKLRVEPEDPQPGGECPSKETDAWCLLLHGRPCRTMGEFVAMLTRAGVPREDCW